MSVADARRLLPLGSIIGLSCNTTTHVQEAIQAGVDYIGIGAVWGTQTKKLTNPIIGVRGVGPMLEELAGTNIRAVAIGAQFVPISYENLFVQSWYWLTGGINFKNLLRTLHGAMSKSNRALDGVAVVSDIVASPEPKLAAERLKNIFWNFQKFYTAHPFGAISQPSVDSDTIVDRVGHLLTEMRQRGPLVHQVGAVLASLLCT